MMKPAIVHTAEVNTDGVTKNGHAAGKIGEGDAAALTGNVNASGAAFQELAHAYQELATRNAKNLTDAIQALSAVKSPAKFFELQQRLIEDGIGAAVSDSQHIAHLTSAVFTAAFEPMKKQIEAAQKTTGN